MALPKKDPFPGDTIKDNDLGFWEPFGESGLKAPPGARGEFVEGRPPGNVGVPIQPHTPGVTDDDSVKRDKIPPMYLPHISVRQTRKQLTKDDAQRQLLIDYAEAHFDRREHDDNPDPSCPECQENAKEEQPPQPVVKTVTTAPPEPPVDPLKPPKPKPPGMGLGFKDFFSGVTRGEMGMSETPWEPLLPLDGLEPFMEHYTQAAGNFAGHIARSIPSFQEVQMKTGNAIAQTLPPNSRVLDIGASEGNWGKAISAASKGGVQTVSLDPNPDMKNTFDTKSQIPGATFEMKSFGTPFDDPTLGRVEALPARGEFDVVHEAMAFQFIAPNRAEHIAEMKRHLKPGGVALVEEKVFNDAWEANERKKDTEYKAKYFTPAALQAKDKMVGFQQSKNEEGAVGMLDNMVSQQALEEALLANFAHVVQYWDAGNFKGYAASDAPGMLQSVVSGIRDTQTPFSTTATPRTVTRGLRSAAKEPDLGALVNEFAQRSDAQYCSTQKGAFANCQTVAVRFADWLRRKGISSRVHRLSGSQHTTTPHPRWQKIPQEHRVHYVTEVLGKYVDFTARQFDESAPFPAIYDRLEDAMFTQRSVYYDVDQDLFPLGRPKLKRRLAKLEEEDESEDGDDDASKGIMQWAEQIIRPAVQGQTFEHYSNRAGLTVIDPKQYGSGLLGEERRRKVNDPANWVDRSYFYDAGTQPESSLAGQNKYTATLPPGAKLYDMGADPDGLANMSINEGGIGVNRSLMEKRIKEAGYFGYRNTKSPMSNAVAFFYPVKVQQVQTRQATSIYPIPNQRPILDERLLLQIPHDVQERYNDLNKRVSDYVKQIKLNTLDMFDFPSEPPESWVDEERSHVSVDWEDDLAWNAYLGRLSHDDVANWVGLEALTPERISALAPNLTRQHALEEGTRGRTFAEWFRATRPPVRDQNLLGHVKETARSFPQEGIGKGYTGYWKQRHSLLVHDIAMSRARERHDRYLREVAYHEHVKPNYRDAFDTVTKARTEQLPLSDVVRSVHTLPVENRNEVDGFATELDGIVNEGVHALDLYREPVSRDDRLYGDMEYQGEKWVPVRRIEGVSIQAAKIPLTFRENDRSPTRGTIEAFTSDNQRAGHLLWYLIAALPDAVSIGFLGVPSQYQRQGVALDLVQKLREKFPDKYINPGIMSDEGAALLRGADPSLKLKRYTPDSSHPWMLEKHPWAAQVPIALYRYGNAYFKVHETDEIDSDASVIRAHVYNIVPGSAISKREAGEWGRKTKALASTIREITAGADKEATLLKYGREYGPGLRKALSDYQYVTTTHKADGGPAGSTLGDSTCSSFNDQTPDNCGGCTFNPSGAGGVEFGYGPGACLLTELFINAPEHGFGRAPLTPYSDRGRPGTPSSYQSPNQTRRRDPRRP